MNTASELRAELATVFAQLKAGEIKPSEAAELANLAGKMIASAKVQVEYAAQAAKPYQRPEMKAYYRQWYAAHAESVKARAVEWTKANPDKRRDVCRENTARQRAKLSDAYVRRMLAQEMRLRCKDIPQSLVEAQRELLKIKRYIREHSI